MSEYQAKIRRFLEKSKKKPATKNMDEDDAAKVQQRLAKKVTSLMKKQKVQQVREIVRGQDDAKPWGQDNQVKVCSSSYRLFDEVEVLTLIMTTFSIDFAAYLCIIVSGWLQINSTTDGNCIYTTSSKSISRWSTGHSPCIYPHSTNYL